jgi:ribosomal protein S18 acetylase RimI-like enzyme
MVVAQASPVGDEAAGRIRPVNLRRDLQSVSALMRLAFGSSMTAERYTAFDGRTTGADDLWLSLFSLRKSANVPGFVWEEDGQIVGNVSLLPTANAGRFLVANVAVHPAHRRRGIARRLVQATLEEVQRCNGRVVVLQVEHQNRPAIQLYQSLGFAALGEMTSWRAAYTQMRSLAVPASQHSPDAVGNYHLRPLRSAEWRQAFMLDQECVAPDLNWPQPPAHHTYKQGFWTRVGRFLRGQQLETWVIADERQGSLLGLARITSEWGRAHRLRLRVHPAGKGKLERPLLAKLIRRLRYLPDRSVRIEHPADDEAANQNLLAANFVAQRTLAVMRLDF